MYTAKALVVVALACVTMAFPQEPSPEPEPGHNITAEDLKVPFTDFDAFLACMDDAATCANPAMKKIIDFTAQLSPEGECAQCDDAHNEEILTNMSQFDENVKKNFPAQYQEYETKLTAILGSNVQA